MKGSTPAKRPRLCGVVRILSAKYIAESSVILYFLKSLKLSIKALISVNLSVSRFEKHPKGIEIMGMC